MGTLFQFRMNSGIQNQKSRFLGVPVEPQMNGHYSQQPSHSNSRDRRMKRFFTSRLEEDKQDNLSACPSIEKELPELSIRGQDKVDNPNPNMVIEQLIKENKLKEGALKTATSMIDLLKEENAELNQKIEELQTALRQRQRTIEILEENRLNFSQDQILGREILTERGRKSQGGRDSKTQVYTPREKQTTVKSRSNLFFQFAQERQRQPSVHRSQDKIISQDHPTFKAISGFNISKKLAPFDMKNVSSRIMDRNSKDISKMQSEQLIGSIALMMAREDLEAGRLMLDELEEFVEIQEAECSQRIEGLGQREREVQAEFEQGFQTLGDIENVSKNLFGLDRNFSREMQCQSVRDIILAYQKTIEMYRQYAAYLKSYLCEAINWLSGFKNIQAKSESNFIPFLRQISREIGNRYKFRFFELQRENKQLKSIAEGLIKNIQMARRGETPVRPWSELASIERFR